MNPLKRALAAGFDATGLNRVLLGAQARLLSPYIRALNYHGVPAQLASAFEEQLHFFARHFVFAGYDDLLALQAGRWPHERPGLILSFDDGLASHARVVAPLLEKLGATGWFMVPAAAVRGAPSGGGAEHTVSQETLSWHELRELDRRHVVGCHTFAHRRLEASLGAEELAWEIAASKRQLEEWLGHDVEVFAWVGGEEWSYSAEAARVIRDAGFAVSFMTNNAVIRPGADLLQLQRTNVEADFPPPLVRFSLSGFFDLAYTPKRRRVNRLTAAPSSRR